jgi:hypothetical protein
VGPVKIAHLYADLLNLYGDRGNILTLRSRLEWRSIPCEVEEITIGEHNKRLQDYDLFFIGGGQDEQQKPVAQDLLLRSNELRDVVEAGKPVLAVCGGYQLLGKSYQTSSAFDIPGLGILDIETRARAQKEGQKQDRLVGNVCAELLIDLKINSALKTLVGFENHSGRTYIMSTATKPLSKLIRGFGNNAEDGFEGAVYKNVFGTYLHGSLLPKNPHLADEIIYRSLETAKHPYLSQNTTLLPLNDKLEISAHDFATKL